MFENSKIFIEIASVIDRDGAFLLFSEFCNRRVYVPLVADPEHRLSRLIGFQRFERLLEFYAGDTLEFPSGYAASVHRKIEGQDLMFLRSKGFTIGAIAAKVKMSKRSVYYALRSFTLKDRENVSHTFEQLSIW